ncbi:MULTISPECIES: TraR/DksA family transcriptional regulator [Terrabacter]|jgi:RNA polymerase-binding transcription factor DksA|uniref:DnaK suppressor protein n=1 Tax=Terrabacter tumescens TaxID=60443 RepID=A0ABQ2IJ00_9MICO|nr:TraR/DksA C4-type zinc finger protein [Terrabacter tumescens]WVM98137.1 TraR/DksA C4-type zinc finger protein [Terrabacter sp. C0L_2]GGN08207.1 DnaK suppressor protein [Terrabacter tumescens]
MSTKTAAHAAELASDRANEVERIAGLRREFAEVVEASEANIADDEHDPEGSTIAYERTQIGALITQAEQHLAEIDAALQRIADGDYGRCEVCGETIPDGRLLARPTARTCIDHAGAALRR